MGGALGGSVCDESSLMACYVIFELHICCILSSRVAIYNFTLVV